MCWWRHSIAKDEYCVLSLNRGQYSVLKVCTYERGEGIWKRTGAYQREVGEGGGVKVQGCDCGRTLWMAPNGTYMTN